MAELSDVQRDFADALRDVGRAVPVAIAQQNGHVSNKRFSVYRNNVYVSLVEALRAQFPVIERLVSYDFFRSMARIYVEQNLPRSPLLFQYGRSFPDFLETFEKVEDLAYLADVARIEFARTQSYHAADASSLSAQELAKIPAERFGGAILELHPSLRLIGSIYPIFSIWRANAGGGTAIVAGEEDIPSINLDQGGEDVMVLRPELQVEISFLPNGGFHFLSALKNGETIAAAAETIFEGCEAFDLGALLQDLILTGAFTGYVLKD